MNPAAIVPAEEFTARAYVCRGRRLRLAVLHALRTPPKP